MPLADGTRNDRKPQALHLADKFSQDVDAGIGPEIYRLSRAPLLIFPQAFVFRFRWAILVIARGMNAMLSIAEPALIPMQP
jgi:hypothetical protein